MMRDKQIGELIDNIQTIKGKAIEAIDFLQEKRSLDFQDIKDVYTCLELICGKSVTMQVFIELNIAGDICPQCGNEKILINWDLAQAECQNLAFRFNWSID